MKKLISMLAAVCLAITMMPAMAFAAAEEAQGDLPVAVQAAPAQTDSAQADPSQEDTDQPEGWTLEDGGWKFYYNGKALSRFRALPGTKSPRYFFDAHGIMRVGWRTIEGNKRYFQEKGYYPATTDFGQMQTGWLRLNDKTYYLGPNSGIQKTGWLKLNDNKYYFDLDSGVMATGWTEINGNKYYFADRSGKMRYGWLRLEGNIYYLNPDNGKLKTGWQTINGSKYYFNPDSGRMHTGWLKLKGKKYYMDAKTGKMKTGLCTIKGHRYYLGKKGVMQTGVVKIKKKLYYFRNSGKAIEKKGWFNGSDKKKRYSYGKGRIASGVEHLGDTWYKFSKKTGVLKKTIGDYLDYQVYGERSSTGYIVAVKRSWHEVRIYRGSSYDWDRSRTFRCSVGASGSRTPKGTFTLGGRDRVQTNSGKTICWWYCTRFSSSHQFQSVLYEYDAQNPPQPGASRIYDGTIGGNVSNGDIRLRLDDAKWIYDNLGSGTKVVIK